MTRLENEKFKRYCHEKGFRGDHTTGEVDAVEYDIFMWYIIIRRDLILPAKSCEKVARFLERTFRYYILFTRCLMVSTDQADSHCFYFRISWILMQRHWFYFFRPLHLVQGLRSLEYRLLQKLSTKNFDQKFRFFIKK